MSRFDQSVGFGGLLQWQFQADVYLEYALLEQFCAAFKDASLRDARRVQSEIERGGYLHVPNAQVAQPRRVGKFDIARSREQRYYTAIQTVAAKDLQKVSPPTVSTMSLAPRPFVQFRVASTKSC